MNFQDVSIGLEVVRSKGIPFVGDRGTVVDFDHINDRVRVAWEDRNATWVFPNVIEPTSKPYKVASVYMDKIKKPAFHWVYKAL
ncbi:hypothetical protein [Arachidicoccus terrestris]|uniref:hypothetical protein n=1 Tax=Arachidicoccus terrestris TaxID=2875539 RepID=UPI001CC82367|nr:hypothetical protein [Arachidicoccus terrestris]UAY56230.1 hypothetical protein K9M52_04220 [Arachidicoccus terrestris]